MPGLKARYGKAFAYSCNKNRKLKSETIMADDRDSLLREVDEELRREQMQKIWERYNGVILGGAALIVLAVGGYKFFESRKIAAAETAGSEFVSAVKVSDGQKGDDAVKALEKIALGGSSGYAALAKLQLAGAYAKAGKVTEALAAYETLGNDSSADPLLKSYAQLQAASLRLGDADFAEIQNRLKPLASDDGVFKITANELLGLAAFKAGKLDEARKHLEPLLIDPKASRAIQDRVKIVMAEIAQSEVAKAPAPATSAPAAAPVTPAEDKTTPAQK
jgi:hypothetical protein